jgi:hypothetical protein
LTEKVKLVGVNSVPSSSPDEASIPIALNKNKL